MDKVSTDAVSSDMVGQEPSAAGLSPRVHSSTPLPLSHTHTCPGRPRGGGGGSLYVGTVKRFVVWNLLWRI